MIYCLYIKSILKEIRINKYINTYIYIYIMLYYIYIVYYIYILNSPASKRIHQVSTASNYRLKRGA